MASTIDTIQLLLREAELSRAPIDMTFPDIDMGLQLMEPFYAVSGAGRDPQYGAGSASAEAGFFAQWRIMIQRGGLATFDRFGGDDALTVGYQDVQQIGAGINRLYPDPLKAARRGHIAIKLPLRRIKGVQRLSEIDIDTQALQAGGIENLAASYVEDAMYIGKKNTAAHLYSDGSAALARVNNAAGYTLAEGTQRSVAIKEGRPGRFIVGQPYVAGTYIAPASYAGSPRVARTGDGALGVPVGVFRCVDIDPDTQNVIFEPEPGMGNIVLSDGDVIMLKDVYNFSAANVTAGSNAINGFENLLINTGNFPGAFIGSNAVSVASVSALRARVQGDEAAPVTPTPTVWTSLLNDIHDIGLMGPDVFIAERSLWTLYSRLDQQAYASVQVPMGATYAPAGGVGPPRLTHWTEEFVRIDSFCIRQGSIIAYPNESMMKFMPRGLAIQWKNVGPTVAGAPGAWRNITQGSQLSEEMAAEWTMWAQIGCQDPRRCIRRIGIHTQRTLPT